MNRQMEPYRQLGFYSDFLSGVPSTSATYGMAYQPPASRASQMFGIGMGLGGLNQAGYFGGGGGLFGGMVKTIWKQIVVRHQFGT